ncbi:MAG: NTP transferase domain-containing protein, partial [Armatimonadetes bacterium]|nr:NTP transferase domain-containing protein [Armatimonadota bacterium]
MNAVVTAGGRISGPLAEQTGQTIKCLIEFDGERLIDRVLRALHEAERIDRVCVVGPPEIRDSLPPGP